MVSRHDTALGGLGLLSSEEAPSVVRSTAQDVVEVFLRELRTDPGRLALKSTLVHAAPEECPEYLQPVHRAWQIAALELFCQRPGRPRLDPQRIDSAGLVVRRVAREPRSGKRLLRAERRVLQAWSSSESRCLGWADLGSAAEERDPDPARRPARSVGHALLDRHLAELGAVAPAEATSPLFVAPPEVIASTGRTVLYGIVPVASSQVAEGDAEQETDAGEGEQLLDVLLPLILPRAGSPAAINDQVLSRDDAEELAFRGERDASPLTALIDLLTRLSIDLAVFDQPQTATSLHGVLAQHLLPYGQARVSAAEVLRDLADVLLHGRQPRDRPGLRLRPHLRHTPGLESQLDPAPQAEGAGARAVSLARRAEFELERETETEPRALLSAPFAPFVGVQAAVTPGLGAFLAQEPNSVKLPSHWPELEASLAARLRTALRSTLSARKAAIRPREPRFGGANERYVLRAFARIRSADGCPPKLVWSAYSPEFRIAPWYAASPVPPPIVPLPALTPANLAAAKPNVAFSFPPGLLDRLQRIRLPGLVDKKLPKDPGIDLAYIVTLNLLIVTIVAFIVLLVIAAILDMIFKWLPYLIVRIPIPKPRP